MEDIVVLLVCMLPTIVSLVAMAVTEFGGRNTDEQDRMRARELARRVVEVR